MLICFLMFYWGNLYVKHEAGYLLSRQVGTFAQQKGYIPNNWAEFSQWSETTRIGAWDVKTLDERYRLKWGTSISDIHHGDIILTVLDPSLRNMQTSLNSEIVMLAQIPPDTTDTK